MIKLIYLFFFFVCLVHSSIESDCDVEVVLTRYVENQGFHRELHSSVEIDTNQTLFSDCILIQKEFIPSGMYVNPDELADLERTGQISGCVGSHVDTEAGKENAVPHEVFIYHTLKQLGSKLIGNFILPFHLRYHKPLPFGGEELVILNSPILLLRCSPPLNCGVASEEVDAPCITCGEERCEWMKIPYRSEADSIEMKVPVGGLHQYYIVLIGTLATTAVGSMYIVKLLFQYHW